MEDGRISADEVCLGVEEGVLVLEVAQANDIHAVVGSQLVRLEPLLGDVLRCSSLFARLRADIGH